MSRIPPFNLIDRYDVEAEIGRGGNAVVYRAKDRVLNRIVAIKLLREDIASPKVVARFHQEVRVTANLEHAHILQVYDTGTFEGRPFVAMELALGPSLAARLESERQLPVAEALSIARDVGFALAYAHARGVVHRDVKPENILLTPTGAFLADFGIARIIQERSADELTSTGVAVGSVLYMSPEQLCAERTIDGRSDQYSLACVLYEMLAGIRPHIAASVDALRALRTMGRHVPVTAHRSSVPPVVSNAIETALASIPADRHGNMEDFVALLDVPASGGLRRSSSSRALMTGRTTRELSVWPRWPFVTAIVAVAAVLTIAATTIWKPVGSSAPSAAISLSVAVEPIQSPSQLPGQKDGDVSAWLQSELRSWDGVQLVNRIAHGDSLGLTIAPSISWTGDSAHLVIRVRRGHDKRDREVSRFLAIRELVPNGRNISLLVRDILGGIDLEQARGAELLPERNLMLLTRYAHAFAEMRAGRLDSAANSFQAVASSRPDFAFASYWAAQVGAWRSPKPVTDWKLYAEQSLRSGALHGTDSLLAAALVAMAQYDYPLACARFQSAVALSPASFEGWFGLGECARLDSVVIRQSGGWRFRSSDWSALRAYRNAVRYAPSSELLAELYPAIWRTTYASGSRLRNGRGDDVARTAFTASPSLVTDSIVLMPIPRAEITAMGQRAVTPTWYAAVRQGRSVAMDLSQQWVLRFPDSPAAWIERARALEVAGRVSSAAGDQSAIDALARAESRTLTPLQRAQVAIVRARLGLRLGDVAGAAETARTALASLGSSNVHVRELLAPLAALLDDDTLTLSLSALSLQRDPTIPAILSDSVNAFQLRAVLGDCGTLVGQRMHLESLFRTRLPQAEVASQRLSRLRRPYRDAVPCLGPAILLDFPPTNPLEEAYAALAVRDLPRARRILNGLSGRRGGATMASFTWDYLFAESWARRAAADTAGSRTLLLSALSDIENMSMSTLEEVAQASGLRRALVLLREMQSGSDAGSPLAMWGAKAALLTSTKSRGR